MNMVAHTKEELEFVLAEGSFSVSENRNYIAVQALKKNCTHLLFIDDDMVFPPETLDRLLEAQKDVVGVVYHARALPLKHTVEYEGELPTTLFECGAVGAGILLIKLDILRETPQPWFVSEHYENGLAKTGEDTYFCHKMKEKGYEVWCDPTLVVKHLGNFTYEK